MRRTILAISVFTFVASMAALSACKNVRGLMGASTAAVVTVVMMTAEGDMIVTRWEMVNWMATNMRAVVIEVFTAVAVDTLDASKWLVKSRQAVVVEASAAAVGMLAAAK